MPFKTPITIAEALEKMHRHEFVLPAIQREFVWGPERICTLFDSLMRGYPVGSLLFWHVDGDTVGSLTFYDFVQTYHQRNAPHCPVLDVEKGRSVTAVLDGQQRLTALNIGLRGSHAEKLPRLWAGNPNAYPVKKLYLDLLFVAEDNDLDQRYRFRFLTPAEAADRSGQFWFEVATIRTFKDSFDALSYAEQNSLGIASGRTLLRLYEAVHKEASLNYFEEMEQDLEKVLNIFIRVNSKAVALSSSDLLLSVATAQWRDRDAREVIHQLVDDLNETGQGFAFTKDLVLKAGLVLLGRGDIRSKVGNFDRQTMREMEDAWDDIDRALRLAALTLSTFGFSSATLQAGSVLIPVAHYLHLRGLSESYLTAAQYADDREEMRTWLMRSLIQSGVWGSGLDTLLSGLRAVLDAEARHGFPRVALEREMGRQGKSLRFDPAQIEDLLDTRYGPRAYPLLALLYPGVDVRGRSTSTTCSRRASSPPPVFALPATAERSPCCQSRPTGWPTCSCWRALRTSTSGPSSQGRGWLRRIPTRTPAPATSPATTSATSRRRSPASPTSTTSAGRACATGSSPCSTWLGHLQGHPPRRRRTTCTSTPHHGRRRPAATSARISSRPSPGCPRVRF